MKTKPGKTLIIGLVIGILIGTSIGYAVFSTGQKTGSWHEVSSFIMASSETAIPGYTQIAYSYPNVYYAQGPLFSTKTDFWRIKTQTVPFYNYTQNGDVLIIYYNQLPMNNIRIWKDQAYADNPFSSVVLLDPTYDYNVTTVGTAQVSDQFLYVSWKEAYVPVVTTQNLSGMGNFLISLDTGIGCFKFTVEEYR